MAESTGNFFSSKIDPMLCTLVKEVTDDPQYLYEIKWDGYRIISYCKEGNLLLASRRGLDYTKKYPQVAEAIKDLGHDLIMDGEVVCFNKEGLADFDALQNFNGYRTPISYCVFDLLWLDGHNLMELPLIQRKEILAVLLRDKTNDTLKYSESYDEGSRLYEEMLEKGSEGIIAKRKDSPYVPGQRGANWLKIPTINRQEFVIGGWAESDKNRLFRSLLFGAYNENGDLEWIGRSGGGYKQKEMPEIIERLKSIEIDISPFANKIPDTKGARIHYVRPELVANFAFATWTKSGRIRKPATFLGFRYDKKASEIIKEVPKDIRSLGQEEPDKGQADIPIERVYLNQDSNWKELDTLPVTDERELPVEGYTIKVHSLSKVLWKKEGVSKADLLRYYASIADYILPYLKDRPLTLYIKHIAPTAPGLYIKDMEGREPEFAEVFQTFRKYQKKGKRNEIDYLVCNNAATLLYIVNLGAIDFNPWSSRTIASDYPDYITIGLDTSNGEFNKVVETAKAAKEVFTRLKIKTFPKTSGKTGMHLLIPCSNLTFPDARRSSSAICNMIHELLPEITTREISVDKRREKIFVDDSQNDLADTIASVYSVRPYHIPTVSTPLEWREISPELNPSDFTINTIKRRIARKGDLFKDLFDSQVVQENNRVLRKL